MVTSYVIVTFYSTSSQEPVRDTAEVARARQEHLAAVARAQALVGAGGHGGHAGYGPQPVADTPEVAAARAHHLAIVQDAQAKAQGHIAVLPQSSVSWTTAAPAVYSTASSVHQQWGVSSTPAPVQDTVEVAAAKAKHLAAVAEAKARVASAGASGYTHQYSGVSRVRATTPLATRHSNLGNIS